MKNIFEKRDYNFNVLKYRKWGYGFAILLLVMSFISFAVRGLNYGIDFQGGVLVELQSEQPIDISKVRSDLSFLKDLSIQSIGTEGNNLLIQTLGSEEKTTGNQIVNHIKETLGPGYNYARVEVIGPRIGDELKNKSFWASVLALLAIAIYIWFRFEWPFAIGCLLSLANNLIATVGLFSILGLDFDMIVVAGLLSLAGYACNDTVVTYDRIRECLKKYKKVSTDEILNMGINQTLSRTILTGLTTVMVAIILLFFGGETLYGFSVAMAFGIVYGTYSSIFIAVPILRYFNIRNLGDKTPTGPYAEAAKYEMEAKKAPLPPYSKCGGHCPR